MQGVELRGGQYVSPSEEERAHELLERRKKLDQRIKEESAKASQQRKLAEARRDAGVNVNTDAAVIREPTVYGHGASHSYFADLYYTSGKTYNPLHPQYRMALDRQFAWSNQVEHEIADGTKFGRFAEKQFREHYRSPQGDNSGMSPGGGADYRKLVKEARARGRVGLSDKGMPGAESRALTSGGGATASAAGGGVAAFVTPIFTEADYVPFRTFGRAFADETTSRPLPPYGMAIYTPQVTSGAAVSTSYTEGSSVTETDPAQGYITAGLIITAGEVTTSQAVLDRTGPNFEYDVVIWDQLERDYAKKWDVYVLTQALLNATSQNWTGNGGAFELVASTLPGAGGFQGQVAKAAAAMETTDGTVLSPNHLFLTPARWRYISAWSDSQGRPVIVPDVAGPFNALAAGSAEGTPVPQGRTGYLLGGLPVHTDPNIPTTTTANFDQALVTDSSQTWSYEGDPVHRVVFPTLANTMQVIFQQYSYGTVLQRYPAAVVKINGTGMSAINYTG
jgi:hypothetical protein